MPTESDTSSIVNGHPMVKVEGRVLIVDDQPMVRVTLRGLLEPLGYKIFDAEHGAAALAMLDEIRPDMLLLDVMMPDMDGFAVLERLRADPQWRDLPVLLVTSLDDRSSRLRGLEAGADDFLTKPVDLEELRARVRTTIRLGRMRRQIQARERFAWTVENSKDGYVWLDRDLRVLGANRVGVSWLGPPGDEQPGPLLSELIDKTFRVRPRVNWSDLAATREGHELTLVRPEQTAISALWLRLNLSPMPEAPGDPVRWMARLENVTALQNTMGQAVTLLGLMNHKLRTPLAMVRTPIELLTQGYMTTDDPDWPRFREQLDGALARLQRDTDQLLQLAELMDRPLSTAGAQVSSMMVMERVTREVASDLGMSPLAIRTKWNTDLAPRIGADALQLVLLQLLGNAIKFHPRRAPNVTVQLDSAEDERVHLCVMDDGPGIPEELQERVWQPMYQIDRVGAGEVPGAGVGLSLVANIAWRLGGRCWIEPSPMGGTCVCLSLPSGD